jgi:hypothetical protein
VVKLYGLAGRLALVGVTLATTMGIAPAPASARVFVSADNPRAGATDVTLSFRADARSAVAGIAFLRVTLPNGVAPGDVSLVAAPSNWNLSRTSDGYNVGGPALDVGEDAFYRVNVERLPSTARQLPFDTVQTYSDGRIEQDNRTPLLALQAPRRTQPPRPPVEQPPPVEEPPAPIPTSEPAEVPPPVPTVEPTFEAQPSFTPPPVTTVPVPSATSTVALAADRKSPTLWLWITVGVVALALGQVGLLAWLRRRKTS